MFNASYYLNLLLLKFEHKNGRGCNYKRVIIKCCGEGAAWKGTEGNVCLPRKINFERVGLFT